MSKTRQKSLAFALLCLIVGVLHFFFGRAILSAVLYVVEIGLFWIVGAVIAICLIAAVIAATFDIDDLKSAEIWLDKKINEDNKRTSCNCNKENKQCNCDECDCDCEDDEAECCDCDDEEVCDYPYCDECIRECELKEDPDAVEETDSDDDEK